MVAGEDNIGWVEKSGINICFDVSARVLHWCGVNFAS
jgi:hypothetical protein